MCDLECQSLYLPSLTKTVLLYLEEQAARVICVVYNMVCMSTVDSNTMACAVFLCVWQELKQFMAVYMNYGKGSSGVMFGNKLKLHCADVYDALIFFAWGSNA